MSKKSNAQVVKPRHHTASYGIARRRSSYFVSAEYSLRHEQRLDLRIASAFAYMSDVANIAGAMPHWLKLDVVTSQPIHMAVGTRISYRLRIFGVPVRWESLFMESHGRCLCDTRAYLVHAGQAERLTLRRSSQDTGQIEDA